MSSCLECASNTNFKRIYFFSKQARTKRQNEERAAECEKNLKTERENATHNKTSIGHLVTHIFSVIVSSAFANVVECSISWILLFSTAIERKQSVCTQFGLEFK